MHVIVGHHCSDEQGVALGVMNEVSITIAKGDVVVFPVEVFYRPLVSKLLTLVNGLSLVSRAQ